jgi:hypothetical protein
MEIKYKYKSLEDFLTSNPLNVDGILDHGWGAKFPVKGIELNATILFADITSFSSITLELNPIETLIYVNNFFSWISSEALINSNGIIDKYIGDEIMIVFANEFGSNNHFIEAVKTARYIMEYDVSNFRPHIGIASGNICVGYVGTPLKYNCSVFGNPVAVAARCASVKPSDRKSIIFPASHWNSNYKFEEIIPPIEDSLPNGDLYRRDTWSIQKPRIVQFKNMPDTEIIEITSGLCHAPMVSTFELVKQSFNNLKESGLYRQYSYKH